MNQNQKDAKQKDDDNKTIGKTKNREDKADNSSFQLGNKTQTKEGTSAPMTQGSKAHNSKKGKQGINGDHSTDTKISAEPHKKENPTRLVGKNTNEK